MGQALGTLKVEMAKTRAGKKSELMDMLTVYHWNELFGPFTRDPATVKLTPVGSRQRKKGTQAKRIRSSSTASLGNPVETPP